MRSPARARDYNQFIRGVTHYRTGARSILLWAALVAPLAAGALAGCARAGGPTGGRGRALDLVLPGLDGGFVDVGAHRGRVVVLHVFTTWSLAAEVDRIELERAQEAERRVVVIGIGLDADGRRLLGPWRDAAGVDWPIALATPEVVEGRSPLGDVKVVPTTIVLDRRGRPAWRHVGGLPPGALVEVVRSLESGARGP
jgi:hypothetical protein